MKVYVATKAKPFGVEEYVGVEATRKKAEQHLRGLFPYMRKDGDNSFVSSARNEYILFIHEEEI
jgi:hypothetical protein